MARFPFPSLPIGWFPVIPSHALERGSIKTERYFGEELVLWRDEIGEPHVMSAFCPHLGAHLGYGGTVQGDQIECPFHGWRFSGSGKCLDIPYSERPHPTARLLSYPCEDRNGDVIVWYHPSGAPPRWITPVIPECETGDYVVSGRTQRVVRTSWQEISENGLDFAHFPRVHRTENVESFEIDIDGPVRKVVRRQGIATPAGTVNAVIESQEFGPGIGVVRFTVDFAHMDMSQFCIVTGITPIDAESVVVRFALMVGQSQDIRRATVVGRLLLQDLMSQLDQDIIIWEHKKYVESPCLVVGDGPIVGHRKWARQFYESSKGSA